MSDFSDRPFVAGSLVGLRAFDVDALGRLRGVTYAQVFTPGENAAVCGGSDPDGPSGMTALLVRQNEVLRQMRKATGAIANTSAIAEVAEDVKKKHVTAGVDCRCGFYAYFDGGNDYVTAERVTGIIEGYGVCTVGSRGFRAEKARLLALVIPQEKHATHPAWFDRYADWCNHHQPATAPIGVLSALSGVALVLVGITSTALAAPWFAALVPVGLALLALGLLTFKADFHAIDRAYPTVRDVSKCADMRVQRRDETAAVRANYADVPVYGSLRDALAAHPLTPPATPTPETADDFWTRSAR